MVIMISKLQVLYMKINDIQDKIDCFCILILTLCDCR